MKNQNTEFLTKIYQNAKMGCDSISYVSEKTDDADMKQSLLRENAEYNDIAAEAAELLGENGETAKEKGAMSHACLWGSVQMNTLADKSSDHIAEMMIQGSIMGVIELSRSLKRYEQADSKVKKLGEKLIETEENNIRQMKGYLQ